MARHLAALALIFLAVAALASAQSPAASPTTSTSEDSTPTETTPLSPKASDDDTDSPAASILTPFAMSPGVDELLGEAEPPTDAIPDDESAASVSPSGSAADDDYTDVEGDNAKSPSDSPSSASTVGLSSMAAASVAVAAGYFIL